MAKGDKKDIAKAKQAVAKAYKSGKTVSPKGYPAAKGASQRLNIANPWAKEDIKTTKKNLAKVKADAKAKANAKNKMKAQGAKINSSATSNYNRRSK